MQLLMMSYRDKGLIMPLDPRICPQISYCWWEEILRWVGSYLTWNKWSYKQNKKFVREFSFTESNCNTQSAMTPRPRVSQENGLCSLSQISIYEKLEHSASENWPLPEWEVLELILCIAWDNAEFIIML